MNERMNPPTFGPPWKFVLIVFLGIAGFFLVTEHTAHVLGVLPYVLLMLCPVMHLFMHRGHGGHGGPREDRASDEERGEP